MPLANERRAHPRYEVFAQVQVTRESEVHIMSAKKLSRGGLFVRGEPTEHPDLAIGTQVEVVVFDAEHPGLEDVCLEAEVVRQSTSGFGLQFQHLENFEVGAIESLLHRLGGAKA